MGSQIQEPWTEGIGQGVVLMNHIEDLRALSSAYQRVINGFIEDVDAINDPKHRIEKNQELDKIIHYFHLVSEYVRDLNTWLTAFGVDGNAKNP